MTYSKKFLATKQKIADQVALSRVKEDLSHAQNTMEWVSRLRPDVDELLLLAGFGHDIERSLEDRYRHTDFSTYDEYKHSHAKRGGQVVSDIMLSCGYDADDSSRVAHIIAEGEFNSDDPDAQLLCDADSISFFDNNLPYYLRDKGEIDTKMKANFMYQRMTVRAQSHVKSILKDRGNLHLLED